MVIERCARNRNYSPTLGRWINQDPAGYINGANTYQFVESNPVNAVDPWGLSTAGHVQKWFEDSCHQSVPGGEFVDAVGALPDVLRIWVATKAQQIATNETGQCPTNGPGPLYNGIADMLNGNAMSPQDHQAVQNWLNTATSQPLLPWLWKQIKIGWAQL